MFGKKSKTGYSSGVKNRRFGKRNGSWRTPLHPARGGGAQKYFSAEKSFEPASRRRALALRKLQAFASSPFVKGDPRRHRATIRGVLSVSSRGDGYLDQENGETIFIPNERLNTALHKDEVEVQTLPFPSSTPLPRVTLRKRRLVAGKVTRITKRAKMRFVGTLEERENRFVLVSDDFRMYAPIVIPRPSREAEKGFKALAEIKEWKTGQEPRGEIIKIIGKKGAHEAEMESIILERGFESVFPQDVEREARQLESHGKEDIANQIAKRRDFRKTLLFTIDPENAKDFDDALSFRQCSNVNGQRYEVGIHIADVSHYVREGTTLDREARERGTSVYLVDRTIPMLPEALSNDLCSLNPDVDRLAFSAVFEMDESGRVHKRWFGKSVIHSQKRFSYESAQEVIDRASSPRTDLGSEERSVLGELPEALRILNSIAKKLRAEKEKKGAIDFEQDEVGFELDEKGRPIRVFKKKRLDTHKLIEEFMLLANREVAFVFHEATKRSGGKIPFIYRTHDVPDSEKLERLRVFVRALGHDVPIGPHGRISGKDLQALFKRIEGEAEESLIKTAAIRSMAKAVYSTANIGHFGLAFEYYTHFTSPIRRYPDLLVHRSLFSILERHKFDLNKLAQLERMADDATQKEIAAAEAERESIKLKQVEYMQERIGREYEGIISGVTEWGIYVEEKETKAEGMVALRTIGDDYYVLDEKNYRIVGERTKKTYTLGARVRFKVAGADLERKTLDYRLV